MLPSAKKFLDITNNTSPDIAVILGSGLTNFFEEKDIQESISYEQLSDFPQQFLFPTKNTICRQYDRKKTIEWLQTPQTF